jgi:hypothetical protein
MRARTDAESRHSPRPARRSGFFRTVHDASDGTQHSRAGGLGRPTAQLDREALGAASADFGEYGKEDRPDPIVPKINQGTLAEMIGTSRTHVNFFMNKFRRLSFIEYDGDTRGKIKVNRSLLNVLLHGKSQIVS